jgi:hypothetical protein
MTLDNALATLASEPSFLRDMPGDYMTNFMNHHAALREVEKALFDSDAFGDWAGWTPKNCAHMVPAVSVPVPSYATVLRNLVSKSAREKYQAATNAAIENERESKRVAFVSKHFGEDGLKVYHETRALKAKVATYRLPPNE